MSKPITIIIQKAENGFALNVHVSAEGKTPFRNFALIATDLDGLTKHVVEALYQVYHDGPKKPKR